MTILKEERILRSRFIRGSRGGTAFDSFVNKYKRIIKLLNAIEKAGFSGHAAEEARRAIVVSLVTSFEVYFKHKLVELLQKGRIQPEELAAVLTQKYSLSDIVSVISKKIDIGEVVADASNFQSLPEIDRVFSKALGTKFLFTLKAKKIISQNRSRKILTKKSWTNLVKLLQLRHEIVHEFHPKRSIKKAELKNYVTATALFVLGADITFDDPVP